MKEIPIGENLEDLILEYAQIVAEDEHLCKLMLRRDEIAYDDPMEARDIQVELNWASYEYGKEKGFEGGPYGPLLGPLKLAQDVVHSLLKGEINDLTSEETRQFIQQEIKDHSSFYGIN